MADAPAPSDLEPPADAPDAGTPDPAATVEQRVVLEGEPDEVWALLTDPDLVEHWLGRPVGLDLAGGDEGDQGDEGRLIDVDGTERHVRVVEREPGRRLRWDWWPAGDDGATTTVEITLVPASPGTEVHVIEARTAPRAATAVTASASGLSASRWRPTTFVDLELALVASRSLVVRAAA